MKFNTLKAKNTERAKKIKTLRKICDIFNMELILSNTKSKNNSLYKKMQLIDLKSRRIINDYDYIENQLLFIESKIKK